MVGHGPDPVGIADGGAAELLDDKGHLLKLPGGGAAQQARVSAKGGQPVASRAVPSEKRARQRAQRAQRQAVIQRQRRRRRNLRRTLTFGGIAAAIVLIVVLIQVSGGSKAKPSASGKSTTSTSTTTTTTTTFPVPTTQPLTTVAVAPTCPPLAGSKKRVVLFTHAPPDCIARTSIWDATFITSVGTFVVQMDAAKSYAAVNNFVFLSLYHYYDGTFFHRVIKGFVDQGGDPAGTGTGDAGTGTGVLKQYGYPGYKFTGNTPPASCKKNGSCYATGDIAMANSGAPSSDGSQFFLVVPGGARTLNTEPVYTNFGHVIAGLSVVETINSYGAPLSSPTGAPTTRVYLLKVTVRQVKS